MRPSTPASPIFAPPSSRRGAGAAPPGSAVSITTIGRPTATVSPGCASSATTVPANGEGSSTAAFAVSISHRIWLTTTVSPTATST
jgi:hypothetical protein